DITGRGFIAIDRTPLTFQTALPVSLIPEERALGVDETKRLADLIERMKEAWVWSDPSLMPFTIDTLRAFVTLDNLFSEMEALPASPHAAMGIDDANLKPALINLNQQPHFTLTGQQLSGKTTALRTWILSLAYHYSPEQVAILMIDPQGYLFNYSGKHSLTELPHVLATASEPDHLAEITRHLQYEYETLPAEQMQPREVFVFIDNYDDFRDLKPNLPFLGSLTRSRPGRPPIHFIVCGTPLGLKGQDEFIKRVMMTRYSMAMDTASVTQPPLNANLPRGLREAELPLGRGFIVRAGKLAMLQIATPYNQDEEVAAALDRWTEKIIHRYPTTEAAWLPMEEESAPAVEEASPPAEKEEKPKPRFSLEEIEQLRGKIAEQYQKIGLSDEFIRMMGAEGIIEMATRQGLIQPEPTNGNEQAEKQPE
ncbi:MAG: hypothetical protein K8I82_06050, partial [Anaerolineae bacterium]|nr:hypothetical protein [Anaerolineae bacterium]